MRKIFTSCALLFAAAAANAQTTATNWTAQDCSSATHTLFNELDNGKIIVFAWVMPCASCVAPTKTAYNVVQGYATSNPGKVALYIADDLGDDDCNALTTWVTSNSVGNVANLTLFPNTSNVINETNFGGSGMPHIIVMAGTDHHIYFNQKNTAANNATAIQSAINAAIGATSVAELSAISFSVSPNPVAESFLIEATKAITRITITSITGQVIKEEVFGMARTNPSINISDLAAGVYMVRITDVDNKTGVQKIVNN
jgi:hypothetical protein